MEGVRVHGGNGKLDQLGWSAKRLKSLGRNPLFSRLPSRHMHLLSVTFNLMFNDGGKGWSWTERVVSSQYACTYF